jgi:hypothetical protein
MSGLEYAVSGGERLDLTGLFAGPLGEGQGPLQRFEGVADVFELVIEVIAVAGEEVLEALEQIPREVIGPDLRIAVGADGAQPLLNELTVPEG